MKKIFTLILLSAGLFQPIFSQQLVSNVSSAPANRDIVITYDLKEDANIKIFISENNGKLRKLNKQYVSGDVGSNVKAGEQRKALWHVLDEFHNKDYYSEAAFGVKATPAFKPFILAQGSYSPIGQAAGGLMVGAVGTVGFYVRGESSFSTMKKCDYICNAAGHVGDYEHSHMPFYSGKTASCEWQALGGFMARLYIPLYLYVGGGYGMCEYYWETIDGKWANNYGYRYKGFAGDIGLMGNIKHFAIAVGVNTIDFRYLSFNVGIGYAF